MKIGDDIESPRLCGRANKLFRHTPVRRDEESSYLLTLGAHY
jgi:hypothetical protein